MVKMRTKLQMGTKWKGNKMKWEQNKKGKKRKRENRLVIILLCLESLGFVTLLKILVCK